MSHVCSLVEQLGNSQISDLYHIILPQEHIDCFDISMQYFVRMEIIESNRHLQKELPNLVFTQCSSHLPFEVFTQVSIFTKLHDDYDVVSAKVAVVILTHILAVNLG